MYVFSWDARQSYYFEPTSIFKGFQDRKLDVRPLVVVGRILVEETHLASVLGVKR